MSELKGKFEITIEVSISEIESLQGFIEKRLYSTPTFTIKLLKWKEKGKVQQ